MISTLAMAVATFAPARHLKAKEILQTNENTCSPLA